MHAHTTQAEQVGVFPCRGWVAPCQRAGGSIKGAMRCCQRGEVGTVVALEHPICERTITHDRAYFPNGVDDPNLALMKVQPQSVYYWESESGKMVQFFKMAVAAVTGKPNIAESAEGKLAL